MIHFKLDSYKKDDFREDLDGLFIKFWLFDEGGMNFFTVLPLLLLFLRFIYKVIEEKEKKIREGMKMMGMTNSSFYLSWITTYLIIFTLTVFGSTIFQKIIVFKESNFFLIFITFWCFGLVLIS